MRGPRRHFVHSKVMAWVAFDRAVRPTELGRPGSDERWREARDKIHAEVCDKGYDAKRGTFTQYYGSTELDAAVLLIPEVGSCPPDDPRVVSTVETIQRELIKDGLVLRYTQRQSSSAGRPGRRGRPDRRRGSVPGLQLLARERAAPDRPAWRVGRRCSSGCLSCATTSGC